MAYEGAALLDVIDSGGWLAVGWMQAGSYDAEPAVWRTRDAGATWEPVHPGVIPPGGRRSDHMERVIAWGGDLLASGLSQEESGGISDRLWLSSPGENEWRSLPAPVTWRIMGMASLGSGEAFLAGYARESEAAVWWSEGEGEWQRSTDPGLAILQLARGLKAGETGLVLIGAGEGRNALWGSPDGVHWLQTLRLDDHSAFWSTAIPTKDRWFVYGTTGKGSAGQGGRQVVWTTTPRCATGASMCPSLAHRSTLQATTVRRPGPAGREDEAVMAGRRRPRQDRDRPGWSVRPLPTGVRWGWPLRRPTVSTSTWVGSRPLTISARLSGFTTRR